MPTTYEETETHARAAERHPPVSTTIVDLGADLLDMLATIGRLFVKESRDNVGKAVEHAIHAMFALGLCLIGAGLLLVAVQALLAAALANVVSREAANILSPTITGIATAVGGWLLYKYFRRKITAQKLTPERSMAALEDCRVWLRRKTSKGSA